MEKTTKVRDLQVMYIQGLTGYGKTLLAKYLCENAGLDYCISSSSNDTFCSYKGEPAIILDDFRPYNCNLSDFLKYIDK